MNLIDAVENNDIRLVQKLLDSGVDINIISNDGDTALNYASVNGNLEIVRLLLKNRADPNIQNDFGWTALMIAQTKKIQKLKKR